MNFVIAGNYQQFSNWLREYRVRDTENYQYLTDMSQLYGYHNVELFCVGSWQSGPMGQHIHELEDRVRAINSAKPAPESKLDIAIRKVFN